MKPPYIAKCAVGGLQKIGSANFGYLVRALNKVTEASCGFFRLGFAQVQASHFQPIS